MARFRKPQVPAPVPDPATAQLTAAALTLVAVCAEQWARAQLHTLERYEVYAAELVDAVLSDPQLGIEVPAPVRESCKRTVVPVLVGFMRQAAQAADAHAVACRQQVAALLGGGR